MHIAGSVFTRYDDIMLDPNVKNCHRLNSATISVKMAYETLSLVAWTVRIAMVLWPLSLDPTGTDTCASSFSWKMKMSSEVNGRKRADSVEYE